MKKLYVVGLGPGELCQTTQKAIDALKESDIIAGYTVYVDLIREQFKEKEFLVTPMKQEAQRCRMAIEAAVGGKTVAMVCSGDSGVYGMAGLIYEIAQEYEKIEIEVVSGISACMSGGGVLGAPLVHDFAVISLSDLLTPMPLIEKRLACAAMADFVICLYNPSSKKRADYLKKACDIVWNNREKDVVCGYVQNIGRENQCYQIMPLSQLRDAQVDMFTTVFIGNSTTKEMNGKMVTPRGYHIEK